MIAKSVSDLDETARVGERTPRRRRRRARDPSRRERSSQVASRKLANWTSSDERDERRPIAVTRTLSSTL